MTRATFDPDASSVGAARRFVRDALSTWGLDALDDPCVLLVSELVTNAVLHARTEIDVSISRPDDRTVRVEVADGSPRQPVVKRYGADAATGRGLLLVDRLARRWGVERREPGKVVWLEMEVGTGASGRRDEALDDADLDDFDALGALEAALGGDDTLRGSAESRCERAA